MTTIEAGIKYYILGAISSCLFLLGVGLLYGLTGTTLFYNIYIYELYSENLDSYTMFLVFILLMALFLFKIGLYPFNF
jgi:NADH:ubiquinone oxidoreductase subunit 2 (subunit N)